MWTEGDVEQNMSVVVSAVAELSLEVVCRFGFEMQHDFDLIGM